MCVRERVRESVGVCVDVCLCLLVWVRVHIHPTEVGSKLVAIAAEADKRLQPRRSPLVYLVIRKRLHPSPAPWRLDKHRRLLAQTTHPLHRALQLLSSTSIAVEDGEDGVGVVWGGER